MIAAIVQAPIFAVMVAPWLLVLCSAIFAFLLFLALKGHWKSYAIVGAAVIVSVSASVLWPNHYQTHGPALTEDKMYAAALNLGVTVLFAIVLLGSLAIGLARQRSKGLSRGKIR